MYLDYFGIDDFPFRLTPDTDYLYMSPCHSRALSYMEYAIFNQEGFVVITGEIGCGKTTLIQKLLSEIDEEIQVAKIFQTQLDEVELLQAILVEFGLNPFSAKKVELLNMLNQYLIDSYMNNRRVVLIVDDAQKLTKRVLSEICMLSGVETQKEKILHVILVGQPELNQTLESPDMEQLLQRISLRYHMRTLKKEETIQYINHRVNVAGGGDEIFNKDTYDIIYDYTGGTPRLINTLSDTALTCAYAEGLEIVNEESMLTAVAELQWKKYEEYKLQQAESPVYEHDGNKNVTNSELDKVAPGAVDLLTSRISSQALVEIANQLKRLVDHLEKKG